MWLWAGVVVASACEDLRGSCDPPRRGGLWRSRLGPGRTVAGIGSSPHAPASGEGPSNRSVESVQASASSSCSASQVSGFPTTTFSLALFRRAARQNRSSHVRSTSAFARSAAARCTASAALRPRSINSVARRTIPGVVLIISRGPGRRARTRRLRSSSAIADISILAISDETCLHRPASKRSKISVTASDSRRIRVCRWSSKGRLRHDTSR